MAKDENNDRESKLKLIHLLLVILLVAVSAAIAWGVVINQQGTNSKEIEKKLDKEIFQMHQTQQTQQFKSLQTTMKEGFKEIKEEIRK